MEDSRLTPRKKQILKAIVDAHINNGEPVGSKYIAQGMELTCSSATIRNEMAELTEMGYLDQPHTSAGRVPTELGYRFYVESLVRQYTATKSEIDEINERLKYKLTEMDEILEAASRLAASFTDYTGIAFKSGAGQIRVSRFDSVYLSPKDFLIVMVFKGDTVKAKQIHLSFSITEDDLRRFTEALNIYLSNTAADGITMPIIVKLEALMGSLGAMVHPTIKVIYETMNELDTADVKFDGVTKLLQYPEYSDVTKFRDLMGVLEEKDRLLDVIRERGSDTDGINVYIGKEDGTDAMRDTTLIYKSVNIGEKRLSIGVIGPKRMNYSRVIGMINQLALAIDAAFGGGELLLPPETENTEGN
ncbi:MAG: heat-inducible transcription repressor HrcA [Clostridia bacterium]|nr:heat-inducible transcription repressor HrcA [Clostridia bacterium]